MLSTFLTEIIDSILDSPAKPGNGFSYQRRIQIRTIITTPYLIFSLKRLPREGAKISTNIVIPDENITIGEQVFTLSGVVMHTGGCHYVAAAKYNDLWWYYDDAGYKDSRSLREFKTFVEFVHASQSSKELINPLTHGTQFYYTPE